MAYLEGTLEEIYKYFGPRTSDIVSQIARPFRKENGKRVSCDELNEDGSKCRQYIGLHAAHLKGRERKVLIQEILNVYATNIDDKSYRIDLDIFEKEFRDKHNEFKSVIKFMCPKHHKQYDIKNSIDNLEYQPIIDSEEFEEIVEINQLIEEENSLIEDFNSLLNNKEFVFNGLNSLKTKNNLESIIKILIDPEQSKQLFRLNYSLLIPINQIDDQLYKRYYRKEIYTDQKGNQYKITNHWFKTQRDLFEKWLNKIT